MARHRSQIPVARVDVHAAVGAAFAELERRRAYEHLKELEARIGEFPPVPGDPPYAEIFPDRDKS